MNRTEHLQAILAKIDKLLADASKRTPGKWDSLTNLLWSDGWILGRMERQDTNTNARFIADCSGNAEAGWRATRAAILQLQAVIASFEAARIEGLEERLQEQQYEPSSLRGLIERRVAFAEMYASQALDSILESWPIELLQ